MFLLEIPHIFNIIISRVKFKMGFYVHASPMNSGSKRFVYKKRPQMHPTPPRSQNTVSRRPENYQYSSLLNPHPSNGDVYYVQHQDGVKQNHHYSFNGPRRSEQHQDKYILQQPGGIFHNGNNPSYDENALPSNLNRNMPFSHQNLQGNNFSPEFQNPNDEPEYEPNVQNSRIGTSMTPINHSIKATVSTGQIHKNRPVAANYHENKSIELDYYRNSSSQKTPFNNTHNKRRSNQTIQEEQESRESPEESKIQTSHHKNYPERSGDQMEEGFVADETVYTSNPGVSRAQGPDDFQSARKTQVQQKHFDSFSNKLGDFSKEESPEPKNANLHFVLMNLQEILARNKIPVNQNPSDSSPDTIIKIVETISHELRLKRDRVEILENEDIEKTKTLDLLKDKNDDLMKAHQKLQRRYDEQDQELEQILRGRENELEEFREKEDAEKQELQYEIENLQSRNKLLERNYNEMENELAITNKNLNNFRAENDNLRYKLRQKEDSIFQNKLIKDKANSSFEVETNHQNILFYQRKEEEKTNNRNPIYTEESEDFSREGGSGDKKFKMQKGEIFDQYNPSKEIREIHKFFKDMNELF